MWPVENKRNVEARIFILDTCKSSSPKWEVIFDTRTNKPFGYSLACSLFARHMFGTQKISDRMVFYNLLQQLARVEHLHRKKKRRAVEEVRNDNLLAFPNGSKSSDGVEWRIDKLLPSYVFFKDFHITKLAKRRLKDKTAKTRG